MRQGANSAVRFSAYSTLKQSVQGSARPGQQLPSVVTFGIGAVAGIITVCKLSSREEPGGVRGEEADRVPR